MPLDVIELSVVIVNYNTSFLFDRLFDSVRLATKSISTQIIVIDNASKDDSSSRLKASFPFVELIQNEANVGFGRANNQALSTARGRYILLLNTDAFMQSDALERSLRYMDENPSVGVLGAKLVSENLELQPSCRYFPTPWNLFLASTGLSALFPNAILVDNFNWDHASLKDCDWVPGCYLLTRKSIVDKIGLFDPRFFLYYEEVDFCRRVKLEGLRVIYFPGAEVVHIGGSSAASAGTLNPVSKQLLNLQIESELLYIRKYFGISGVLNEIFLNGLVASGLKALNGLRRRDWNRVGAANAFLASLIAKCIDTRLGSRPTT